MSRPAYFALLFFAAIATGLFAGQEAEAHTAPGGSFNIIYVGEDAFRNWDFRSQQTGSAYDVDWPVTMVYYNYAWINKVKDTLHQIQGIHNVGNSDKNAILTEDINQPGGGWVWDTDSGVKDGTCPDGGQTRHMRLYADSNDYLQNNMGWGFYVFGTTHVDQTHWHALDLPPKCHHHWVGNTDQSQDWWELYSDLISGWLVYPDSGNFLNAAETFDLHGSGEDHYVNSNGLGTFVYVP